MTHGPNAYSDPHDGDRIFPDGFAPEDPFHAAILGGNDIEGVPIPYSFQRIQALTQWRRDLDAQGLTPALLEEIKTNLATDEEKYPNSPVWDRQRGMVAEAIFKTGHVEEALDVIHGMHSPHQMVETLVELSHQEELVQTLMIPEQTSHDEGEASVVIAAFLDHMRDDQPKRNAVLRAVIDAIIDQEPRSASIDVYERQLATQFLRFDAVQSWADSQRILHPMINWDEAVRSAKDDKLWATVPLNLRRSKVKQYALALHELHGDLQRDGSTHAISIRDIPEELDHLEETYPRAKIWDRTRCIFASMILRHEPTSLLARELAGVIKEPRMQAVIVAELCQVGQLDDAFHLATRITSPRIMAETLLYDGWGEKGVNHIATIIANQKGEYPVATQIGCMEAVRVQCVKQGNMKDATRWKARIRALRGSVPPKQGT